MIPNKFRPPIWSAWRTFEFRWALGTSERLHLVVELQLCICGEFTSEWAAVNHKTAFRSKRLC